ncbi:reverse transcriptase zinc-binding domain-containing protein [Tanacetum coccineum]
MRFSIVNVLSLFGKIQMKNSITDTGNYVLTPSMEIYDTMQSLQSPIGTHCVGYAYNLAGFLLAAGENGQRFAMPLSRITLESPAGTARGQVLANMQLMMDLGMPLQSLAKWFMVGFFSITRVNKLVPFHTKLVMEYLCPNAEKVKWYDVVWFKQCIPKHSCLWLAMKERLLTQDRIMSWGTQSGLLCPLCSMINDSHSHLFFLCEYSKKVWGKVAEKMNLNKIEYKWDDIINELAGKKNGNNIWSAVRRLSLAAVVYFIWQERNQRIFRGDKRDADVLFDTINETIMLKLMSLRVKESYAVKKVAGIWEIQFKILK